MVDKILVSSNGALDKKYGAAAQGVLAAIAKLVAADQGRGTAQDLLNTWKGAQHARKL